MSTQYAPHLPSSAAVFDPLSGVLAPPTHNSRAGASSPQPTYTPRGIAGQAASQLPASSPQPTYTPHGVAGQAASQLPAGSPPQNIPLSGIAQPPPPHGQTQAVHPSLPQYYAPDTTPSAISPEHHGASPYANQRYNRMGQERRDAYRSAGDHISSLVEEWGSTPGAYVDYFLAQRDAELQRSGIHDLPNGTRALNNPHGTGISTPAEQPKRFFDEHGEVDLPASTAAGQTVYKRDADGVIIKGPSAAERQAAIRQGQNAPPAPGTDPTQNQRAQERADMITSMQEKSDAYRHLQQSADTLRQQRSASAAQPGQLQPNPQTQSQSQPQQPGAGAPTSSALPPATAKPGQTPAPGGMQADRSDPQGIIAASFGVPITRDQRREAFATRQRNAMQNGYSVPASLKGYQRQEMARMQYQQHLQQRPNSQGTA